MEKSIESIWNEGFLKNESLLAPKITNLYTQKSKLLLEKFKRTYQIDNKSLIPLAIIVGIGVALFGYILLGVYLMIIFLGLYFINRKLLSGLESIELYSNSYNYLLEYRNMINKIIKFYTKLIGLGFPFVCLVGYWLYFKDTEIFLNLMERELLTVIGILLALAFGLSMLGLVSYRLTSELVYGKYIRKLNDIIKDMEELSKPEN